MSDATPPPADAEGADDGADKGADDELPPGLARYRRRRDDVLRRIVTTEIDLSEPGPALASHTDLDTDLDTDLHANHDSDLQPDPTIPTARRLP